MPNPAAVTCTHRRTDAPPSCSRRGIPTRRCTAARSDPAPKRRDRRLAASMKFPQACGPWSHPLRTPAHEYVSEPVRRCAHEQMCAAFTYCRKHCNNPVPHAHLWYRSELCGPASGNSRRHRDQGDRPAASKRPRSSTACCVIWHRRPSGGAPRLSAR